MSPESLNELKVGQQVRLVRDISWYNGKSSQLVCGAGIVGTILGIDHARGVLPVTVEFPNGITGVTPNEIEPL